MKFKILMENQALSDEFLCSHGLCIYIETEKHKVLLDTGGNSLFLANAAKLGIDLSEIDTLVLSHGHYDHAGGLVEFMNINSKADIYAAAHYDSPHYRDDGSYIGVEPVLVGHPRIKVLSGDKPIDDELTILSYNNERLYEKIHDFNMTEGVVDSLSRTVRILPEKFIHEQYLLVNSGGKRVIFSGCSHKGIINLVKWTACLDPDAYVGGFHLMEYGPERFEELDGICRELLKNRAVYYTGHCTGAAQYAYMSLKMGERVKYIASGAEFEI